MLQSSAALSQNVAFGKGCLLQRATTRGPTSDGHSEGQYSEPLGLEVLLPSLLLLLRMLLLLLPLLLLLMVLLLLLLLLPLLDALPKNHYKGKCRREELSRLDFRIPSIPLLCLGFIPCNCCSTFGSRQRKIHFLASGVVLPHVTYQHIHL